MGKREMLLMPPRAVLSRLNIGNVPVVADETGRRLSIKSLRGLHRAQHGLCCYCCEPMTLPPLSARQGKAKMSDAEFTAFTTTCVTRDHLLSKAGGGSGVAENFAAACRACNEEKAELSLPIYLLGRITGKTAHYLALKRANTLK
jgi:hypothetical protein